ncbi:MAG TPA: NAD(P)-dependent oxidoreductase [Cytophagaceae bacterium]|jgi:alanine dehydrogenase
MGSIKIGILKEGRIPTDKRVPLLPEQCKQLAETHPNLEFFIQPSQERCIKDGEYAANGIELKEDLSECDILFGVKEVPIPLLMHDKTYFFFSHTIKKQPHNRKLLQTIMEKKITLIDYECLTDVNGNRIIAFGKYAGIVGCYNALKTYGEKYKLYSLKPAFKCFDFEEVKTEMKKIKLPAIKIVLTGSGRVSKGVEEVLELLKIKKVEPKEFLSEKFEQPVYCNPKSSDYYRHKITKNFDSDFYHNPHNYYSTFYKFSSAADILVAGAYWNPDAPSLFTKEDMYREDFRVKVVADITCDINGSIPCTKRASSINDPVYDYNPYTGELELAFSDKNNISVMAIDNLPGELSRDASKDFGTQLMNNVIVPLLGYDPDNVIERGKITNKGKLTSRFKYLEDFVNYD